MMASEISKLCEEHGGGVLASDGIKNRVSTVDGSGKIHGKNPGGVSASDGISTVDSTNYNDGSGEIHGKNPGGVSASDGIKNRVSTDSTNYKDGSGKIHGKNPNGGSGEIHGKNPNGGSGEIHGKNPNGGSGEIHGKNPNVGQQGDDSKRAGQTRPSRQPRAYQGHKHKNVSSASSSKTTAPPNGPLVNLSTGHKHKNVSSASSSKTTAPPNGPLVNLEEMKRSVKSIMKFSTKADAAAAFLLSRIGRNQRREMLLSLIRCVGENTFASPFEVDIVKEICSKSKEEMRIKLIVEELFKEIYWSLDSQERREQELRNLGCFFGGLIREHILSLHALCIFHLSEATPLQRRGFIMYIFRTLHEDMNKGDFKRVLEQYLLATGDENLCKDLLKKHGMAGR